MCIRDRHYSDPETYNARYAFDPQSKREPFVIDTPPPYPSGTWHIGAVAQYSMIDVIARSQRLLGKEVYFPWGVDRNGINIEFTVEKNTKRKMRTYERGEFLDLCASTIETFTQAMRTTAKRVGLSCDFDREYLTDAPDYRSVTQAIFIDLFEQGAVVEDLRPNIYDPVEGTTIADAEVERVTRKTKLVDVRWHTDDGQEVVISTTRPEMICACGVVVVHPDDERYRTLVGQTLALPMPTEGREAMVEVRTHPSVKMEFGSGVLMVCSFGDQNDVAVFRELGLDPFQAIDLEGRMTALAGPLAGMTVLEARAAAIDLLEAQGKIANVVEKDQEVPVSERGKNPVEIILLKEWYVRQTHMQDRLRELVDDVNSTRLETANSCWIGWTTSPSIGRSLDDGGTTRKSLCGTPTVAQRSSFRQKAPTSNLGVRNRRQEAVCSTGWIEPSLARGTTCVPPSTMSWEKRRSSTRGWTPQIQTSS